MPHSHLPALAGLVLLMLSACGRRQGAADRIAGPAERDRGRLAGAGGPLMARTTDGGGKWLLR